MTKRNWVVVGTAITLTASMAWLAISLDLFREKYLNAIARASALVGTDYTQELDSLRALAPDRFVAIFQLKFSEDGRRIDGVSGDNELARIIAVKVAARTIFAATESIARAAAEITQGDDPSTEFIAKEVNETLSIWNRADRICQLLGLGESKACPKAQDARFSELIDAVQLRGEKGLALVFTEKTAMLAFPPIYYSEFCNSAPYGLQFLAADKTLTSSTPVHVKPGECQWLSHGAHFPGGYFTLMPDKNDPALTQLELHAGQRDAYLPADASACRNEVGDLLPLDSSVDVACFQRLKFQRLPQFRESPLKVGDYPVLVATIDYVDDYTARRTPGDVLDDHAQRRRYARDLSGTLLNRGRQREVGIYPLLVLDATYCAGDDPMRPGVLVCGVIESPHGSDPIAYPGETIYEVNDIRVWSPDDIETIMAAFSRVAHVKTPLRVLLDNDGIREGLAIFNPATYSTCPFDSADAGMASFVRSLTFTLSDHLACGDPDQVVRDKCLTLAYEQMILRRQFCPSEDFLGEVAGMMGSVSGVVLKGLAKVAMRGAARRVTLAALASSAGVGLLQVVEELTYAFVTEPPVSPSTPLLERAAPYAATGFVFGFLMTRGTP